MSEKRYIEKNEHLRKPLLGIMSLVFIAHLSCTKLVEVNSPTTNITGKNVFTNDGTAAAILTGLYTQISGSSPIGGDLASIGFLTGLSGDELSLKIRSSTTLNNYYLNNLNSNIQYSVWTSNYPKLFTINTVIENIPSSNLLSPAVRKQLLGEAKFMRAFIYFYLVNLYGDVPLVTTTDYTVTSVLPRTPSPLVWAQIISDLKDAIGLLTPDYADGTLLNTTDERVRPNKWAATALLARCYIFVHDWKNAEAQSTEVINNTRLYHLDSLGMVFLKNSAEAIWQLQPINFGSNTEDAKVYIIHSTGFNSFKPVFLNMQLVNSFDTDDQRKAKWIDSITLSGELYYFSSKYKSDSLNAPITEYNTVLRLGEQFLIRAEARAQENDIDGALSDLNLIRERAWLNKSNADTKDKVLSAIYHERQLEFFTEWGHRWIDLKRTQMTDAVMSIVTPQKGGTWSPNWKLYPIPSRDILSDANLTQNDGY